VGDDQGQGRFPDTADTVNGHTPSAIIGRQPVKAAGDFLPSSHKDGRGPGQVVEQGGLRRPAFQLVQAHLQAGDLLALFVQLDLKVSGDGQRRIAGGSLFENGQHSLGRVSRLA
jgi:hypothetical protein